VKREKLHHNSAKWVGWYMGQKIDLANVYAGIRVLVSAKALDKMRSHGIMVVEIKLSFGFRAESQNEIAWRTVCATNGYRRPADFSQHQSPNQKS
jgi:hypothetical protein